MTTNSATLLDHIYTNLNNNVESGILIYEISDHLPTFCSISCKPLRTKTEYKFRDMKSFDREKFTDDISILEEKVNHRIHTQSDTETTIAFFIENVSQIVHKHAPLKENSRKETILITKPWITKGIVTSIQTKNKIFRKCYKRKDADLILVYKQYTNKLTTIRRIAKQNYCTIP